MTTTYAALLRAVNVGGSTLKMDVLRDIVGSLGCDNVRTYIQSGNVVFSCPQTDPARLAGRIEKGVAAGTGINTTVMVRTHQDLDKLIGKNPFVRSGHDVSKLHVTFLATAPAPALAKQLVVPDGWPEELVLTGRDIYLYYPAGYGRSKLTPAYIEKRLGVPSTTRNWNTVLKLRELTAPS